MGQRFNTRANTRFVALCCAACLYLLSTSTGAAELVWGRTGELRALRITPDSSEESAVPERTPLGSLWKLFVYAYLHERALDTPDYVCTGKSQDVAEESYCCSKGQRIGRERALVQSCGLYFSPQRLGLVAQDWSAWWKAKAQDAPAWLGELGRIQPATEVPVASLLHALSLVDDGARRQAMRVLQRTVLEPRARNFLAHAGAAWYVKTWSWHDAGGRRMGGFGGWLADGTPVWLRGWGTSATVMESLAAALAENVPARTPPDEECVQVRFFNRYPLKAVRLDGNSAAPGALRGLVQVQFDNGRTVQFQAQGDIRLGMEAGVPVLWGRFGLNDYIARVLEREAAAQPVQAARALGIAARTYLARHAAYAQGCYQINDDSRTQRVAVAPPGRDARSVADWSDGLILQGADGRFHGYRSAPGRMAWKQAVAQAQSGLRWDEILEQAYGTLALAQIGQSDAGACQPLLRAQAWLERQHRLWNPSLLAIAGYERPARLPTVCQLQQGNPYADVGRERIYATGVVSANERLTLAHEYLHFGLAQHPRGRDEAFVEDLARKLLELP